MNELSIREPKKCDAWAGILTGVGQMFYGGKDEVCDVMMKYQVESGYKVKPLKTDQKRYIVCCLFKEEKGCFNKYCCPMLIIDATFLTGKFRGGLMVACGKTGNQEILPLAFGLVSGENDDNWHWFLENLKGIVDADRPLTIISDRGTGLLNNVPLVFPNDFHSYCSYHMKSNIPVSKGKSRQIAIKLFEQCYSSVTKEQFLKAVSSMHNLKLFSVIEWMKKIPLKNWVSHEFEGERFGELTSNIAESFNSLIKHEKRLQAIELIECIRARTMETIWKRKVASSEWNTRLTPNMQARLDKRITDCRKYKVRRASEKGI
ncbi:protein FAR-RED ELONGATED HYPOCOTYL 3-like [Papaver somniferum]|uniref:protein FAR-RED ELONGATED HYPOCOTYL 3-like n=1 Tax=Papaver somniferum TaxID=3469 RepID=UPI000E6F9308|nr:protein FAR-RED ELONGATED HYPOCOTYL 3-like [Papaver somniferum]